MLQFALCSGLPLNISRSPLLSGSLLAFDDCELDTVASRLSVPLPSLTFAKRSKHHPQHGRKERPRPLQQAKVDSVSRSSSASVTQLVSSVPGCRSKPISTNAVSSPSNRGKPLPSIPVPAKDVIALLDLLDRLDADMAIEVYRVKEGISELRDLIILRKEEKDKAIKEAKRRTLAIETDPETKLVDGDFWLNV